MHDSDHGRPLRTWDLDTQRITSFESFLDLNYVFAEKQLSYRLLDHLTELPAHRATRGGCR